jgi:hypothetical protein
MATEKNWANGMIITEKETQYGILLKVGIKVDEFIEWLQSLEVNEKGFVNLDMGPRKDGDRWNAWENDYKPDAKKTSSRKPAPPTTKRKPAPVAQQDDGDDLPF